MAHSPEKKAAVIAMLRTGATYSEITLQTGIKEATISRWASEMKTEGNGRASEPETEGANRDLPLTFEARQERFDRALDRLLFTGMDMLQAWAELGGDKTFVREKPTEAKDLGNAVLDRLDRIMAVVEANREGQADEPGAERLPNVAPATLPAHRDGTAG